MTQKIGYFTETIAVLFVGLLGIRFVNSLNSVVWFAPYVLVAAALIQVYLPIAHARWRHESIDAIDRSFSEWSHSLSWFLMVSLIVFIPYLIANHLWQDWVTGRHYFSQPVPGWPQLILENLILIALPEEFFFRGWLQGRLKKVFSKRWSCFGVRVGLAWILTAVLFAAAHSLISYQWWHFSIFFPALIFGWLREKTGSITAAVLFHCASNLVAIWIGYHYL